jgi:thymidylate synthase (FAD)
MSVKLITHTPEPEKIIAYAASVCYSNERLDELYDNMTPERIDRMCKLIIDIAHESVLEHATFTFAIDEIDRAESHQLVRHRIMSASQRSQRFVYEGNFDYMVPEIIENNDSALSVFHDSMIHSCTAYDILYNKLIESILKEKLECDHSFEEEGAYLKYVKGIIENDVCDKNEKARYKEMLKNVKKQAQENARSVLPNATETMMVITVNAREIKHMCSERMCMRSQDPIKETVGKIHSLCVKTFPKIFSHMGPKCKILGYCPENNLQHEKCKGKVRTKNEVLGILQTLDSI